MKQVSFITFCIVLIAVFFSGCQEEESGTKKIRLLSGENKQLENRIQLCYEKFKEQALDYKARIEQKDADCQEKIDAQTVRLNQYFQKRTLVERDMQKQNQERVGDVMGIIIDENNSLKMEVEKLKEQIEQLQMSPSQ